MKFFKKTDIIVVGILLVLCICIYGAYRLFFSKKGELAQIYYGSQLVKTVDLTLGEDKTFSIPQDEHVIFHVYKNGTIRFESSDCPDKICVRTGLLGKTGESAACLPNKIILKIVPKDGYKKGDVDIIT